MAKKAKNDPVSHPSHYTQGKIEVIDFISDKKLSFNIGNVIKYAVRAGIKSPATRVEDLRKAAWYLNREIEELTMEHKRGVWRSIKKRARKKGEKKTAPAAGEGTGS